MNDKLYAFSTGCSFSFTASFVFTALINEPLPTPLVPGAGGGVRSGEAAAGPADRSCPAGCVQMTGRD